MDELRIVTPAEARASIADAIAPLPSAFAIGDVRLQAHQSDAVRQLDSAISRYGGALLCDPVGTGKTFTALGLASRFAPVTIVAPAVLRDMWLSESAKTGVRISFISHESLSRVEQVDSASGLVIIDEAHHVRNPATRRFRALSTLVEDAKVLLLTATPVHNQPRDLAALQSLYLGERAFMLEPGEIAEMVVRRDAALAAMPELAPVEWIQSRDDGIIPEMILGLPPPVPVREGGVAHTLIRHSLVRQWASSDAALRGALVRRCSRAAALIAALESGTYPSQGELSAWAIGDDAVQLAFPELVATESAHASELLPIILKHAAALDGILSVLNQPSERDRDTAARMHEITRRHAGIPVIAFSAYEDSVNALFRHLAPHGGVAALTGRGGRVAGGVISRREVIARFAPVASGRLPPSPANRVTLLLATDLLSEGMNLQDAGVVVHVDLPYTHARLEQRTGRVARLGSSHAVVHSYAFKPPASAEVIARIELLIGLKLSFELDARSVPEEAAEVSRCITQWRGVSPGAGVVAAVHAEFDGFLAAVRCEGRNQLLAGVDDGVRDDPSTLLQVILAGRGSEAEVRDDDLLRCKLAVVAHLNLQASLAASRTSGARRLIHRRISSIVRRARPHERARLIELAERARSAANISGGSRLDETFSVLADASAGDDDWLASIAGIRPARERATIPTPEIVAMLLLVSHRR